MSCATNMGSSPTLAGGRQPAGITWTLDISSRRLLWSLIGTVAMLAVLSTIGQIAKHLFGHTQLKGFVPLFYLDEEASVPTWYSSAALMLAALLLAVIAAATHAVRNRFQLGWLALAFTFVLLSVDEVAMLHEYPIEPLRAGLGTGGLLYYTWVVPGAALVALFGLTFWQFLRHLPAATRRQMYLAAALFVGGAIGVEMISGQWADVYGENNLVYALIVTVEEVCEMLGVVVFIHALIQYMNRHLPAIRILLPTGRIVQ